MLLALLILVPSTVRASDYNLMCCDGFYHKEGGSEGGSLGCTNVSCPEGTKFCATGYGQYKTVKDGKPVRGEVSFENCATPGDFKLVYPLFDGFSNFSCQALGTKMYNGKDWSLTTGQQAAVNLTCTEPVRQTKAAMSDHNISYMTFVSLIFSVVIREMKSDK